MKPEEMYQHLKELAEKLQIVVLEQNLRQTPGIKVKSGMCTVKGETRFIIDKHMPVYEKNEIMADCLGKMSLENIYVVPAVREFIKKYIMGFQQDRGPLPDTSEQD